VVHDVLEHAKQEVIDENCSNCANDGRPHCPTGGCTGDPSLDQSAARQAGDSRDVNRADNYWGLLGLLGVGGLLGLRRRRDEVNAVDRDVRPSDVRRTS
jgi:MYXO-CTERM domain-containing protein